MDFVDQIDLEPAPAGRVLHVFQQLAGVLDLGAGGGVHLDQVYKTTGVDFPAGGAFAAGMGGNADFTVERLGENAGDGGLAHPTGAGEQKGVVQALLIEGVGQGANHVFLAGQFVEGARPPLARQNLIAHAPLQREVGAATPAGLTPAPEATAAAAPFRA